MSSRRVAIVTLALVALMVGAAAYLWPRPEHVNATAPPACGIRSVRHVPAGGLIYYIVPGHQREGRCAVNWNGDGLWVPLGELPSDGLTASPDGSYVLAGRDMYAGASAQGFSLLARSCCDPEGLWSDDGRFRCGERGQSLVTISPIGRESIVGPEPSVSSQGSGVFLIGCSGNTMRAVLAAETFGGSDGVTDVWSIDLSSGVVVGHYELKQAEYHGVSASPDGEYVALYGSLNEESVILDLTSGQVVRRLGRTLEMHLADTLALTTNTGNPFGVVNWKTGRAVWLAPASAQGAEERPEPGGDRILVAVRRPDFTSDLWIVDPGGSTTLLARRVVLG